MQIISGHMISHLDCTYYTFKNSRKKKKEKKKKKKKRSN